MVATVQIIEKNGTAGTPTQKDSGTIRFKNADNAVVNASDPLIIPTSGTEYSYEKWTRLNVTVAPDNSLSNLKFYTDGANGWTGVGLHVKAAATYVTPALATSTAGFTNAFTYTSGSALDLGTAAVTGTGEKGSHAVMIMTVATSATPGTLTAETATYSYDET
jgi:hypothetical protein